jgi:hypothetical protein
MLKQRPAGSQHDADCWTAPNPFAPLRLRVNPLLSFSAFPKVRKISRKGAKTLRQRQERSKSA